MASRSVGDYDTLTTLAPTIPADDIMTGMDFASIDRNLSAQDLVNVFVDLEDDSKVVFEFLTEEKSESGSGMLYYETRKFSFLKKDVVLGLGLDAVDPNFTEHDPIQVVADAKKAGNFIFDMGEDKVETRT